MVNLLIVAGYFIGERILQIVSWHDVTGSEIIEAKSFVDRADMRIRGSEDIKRDIISIVCTEQVMEDIIRDLENELYREDYEELRFIVKKVETEMIIEETQNDDNKTVDDDLYAVYVIVEKGYSEEVIELSQTIGVTGATIIPAEGNKFAERYLAPGLNINPHKEIILMITDKEKAMKIMDSVRNNERITGKGKGIAYSLKLEDFSGFKN